MWNLCLAITFGEDLTDSAPQVYTQLLLEMFYLTTHSTHFIYGYMASNIWLKTNLIVRKETRCRHIGYSFRLTTSVVLYVPYVEHWLEREIAQWVHPMKDRSDDPSHHERTLLPRSSVAIKSLLCSHATANRSGFIQGSDGQPKETTHHQQGISQLFGVLKLQNITQLFSPFGRPSKLHPIPLIEMLTYSFLA